MPDAPLINADCPLVLLPVRLETRFFGLELRIRVYPDKIHVDTHEPELNADEQQWGKHFHDLLWRAANDDARRKAAWAQLADRFGAERAAWIARQLTPTNPADRPASPVPPEQVLTKPPKFPQVPVRPEAQKNETWSRAPRTGVLPDQWMATAFIGGVAAATATGKQIPDPLPVGPNPQASVPESDDTVPVDDGMKWMVDFDEAEKVGMAMRLQLPPSAAPPMIDLLVVFGVKKSLDSKASATRLKDLIEAHKYTDGLSLLLQGTPTNNTEEIQSGFSTEDPGHEKSFRLILGDPQFQPGDGSNGDELRNALGLPADILTRTANANAREQFDARNMNRALWASTWGYYLEQMIGLGLAKAELPGVFPVADIDANLDWARRHFVDHVRAGGPLPALRAGKQPYGILPVTALDLWAPVPEDGAQASKDEGTVGFLRRLLDYWSAEGRGAAQMGRNANPDVDFASVFSMDALSSRYSVRNVFGLFYASELFTFLGTPPTDAWLRVHRSMTLAALEQIGGVRGTLPRAALTVCDAASDPLSRLALIQTAPGQDLAVNYIDLLLKAQDLDSVLKNTSIPAPFSLLYLLLRHSMLLEYAGAAGRALGLSPNQRAEPEHVRFTGLGTETSLDQITKAALHTGPAFTQPVDAQVQEFRKSLDHLKTLKADSLSLLMRGALDLSAYRLDAWVTSFATKRLKSLRRVSPTGVYLGGYGWVEDLRPAAAPPAVPPPPGESAPLFAIPNDPGFVHAPSLDHAATVAVLRSGHLTHSDPARRDLLAIDLSSERARIAQWLLDGVKAGQPLGALLGYRFERGLHEGHPGLNLDRFIDPFRQLAPLNFTRVDEQGQAVETVPANHVVDGLSLNRQWKTEGIPFLARAAGLAGLGLTIPHKPEHQAVISELNALAGLVDAVSDALVAESVHQVVRGNPTRAAATLDALERGEAPPPDLEVIRTPRTGSAFTHRVVTLLPGNPGAAPLWNPSQRSLAEPCLNAWAAKLLGNPANVRCVVERVNPATGAPLEKREIRLKDLRLAPLDAIYAPEASADSPLSELEQRVLYAVRRSIANLPADAVLRLSPLRDPTWPITDLSWSEFMEVVRTARGLLTGGRALRGADLTVGGEADTVDTANLQQRADRAATALGQARTTLQTALSAASTTTLEPLRGAMLAMTAFGIPGAVPLSAAGKTEDDLRTLVFQARSLDSEAASRLAKSAADTEPIKKLESIFGAGFVVLPRFRPANAAELQRALAASTQVQDGDSMAVTTFHQRVARVREGVARLDDSLRYAEAIGAGDTLTLLVAQLPQVNGDRWVGLPAKQGVVVPPGRLSLIAHVPETMNFVQPIAGLMIDEWVEVVPNASETTGVVFQYNQPDSFAPQAILVAVPPNPSQQNFWTTVTLQQVLRETIALVHIRAVTPDMLDEVAHYLPAAYFAMNIEGHTITTDFLNPGP